MNILGIDVSENASRQIKSLCDSFQRPVRFLRIDDTPDKTGNNNELSGGDETMYYPVYLQTGADRRLFEANALHELFHIRQYEAGFPALCNKNSQLYSTDRDFVEELGRSVFSVVLDIEVFDRMRECRYPDAVNWLIGDVFGGLLSAAPEINKSLNDKYSFANLVITFAKVLCYTDSEQDGKVREMLADYPLILERSFDMREMLRENHPDTPDSAVIAMGGMIDMSDLWDLFYIRITNKKIRTRSEYESFKG